MRTPGKEALRAMVQNGEVDSGYLLAAVSLYQLIDDGADFSLTETHIVIFSQMWCPYCTLLLPETDWQADYLIDIILPFIYG